MARKRARSREEIYDSKTAETHCEIRDLTPEELDELEELLQG